MFYTPRSGILDPFRMKFRCGASTLQCMSADFETRSNMYKPLLPGLLNGHTATFFLDTGSDISIISTSALRKYGFNTRIFPSHLQIHGISGVIGVAGWIRSHVSWAGHVYVQNFLVLHTNAAPGNVLLGYDFLRQTRVTMNPGDHAVSFAHKEYKLTAYPTRMNANMGPHIYPMESQPHMHYPEPRRYETTDYTNVSHMHQIPNPPHDTRELARNDCPKITSKHENSSSNIKRANPKLDQDGNAIFTASLTSTKEMNIPAFSRIFMDVKVNVKLNNSKVTKGTFILSPLYMKIDGLSVIPGLYNFNNSSSQIFVINTTNIPIKLPKHISVACLELLNYDLEVETVPDSFVGSITSATTPRYSIDKSINETLGAAPLHFNDAKPLLKALFNQFPDVLPSATRPIGKTSILKHEIKLIKDATPVRLRAYKIPHSRRSAMSKEIQAMVQGG